MRPQTDAEASPPEGPKKISSIPHSQAATPTVPDYDLLRRIGGGAYGEVWLARSQATGILRAAKIVWRDTFEDERPFRREFEGIQRFERISREHPSQLALYHIGRNDADGNFYYVMELADNLGTETDYSPHTLRADLEQGRLPAARVLEIGLALAEALGHLHAKGLIHRDVKPSNVIFVNGRPKLADIGLVTDASDSHSIVGTEGYLSPQGLGTPQADIFALGKVLYEAATGLDRRELPKLPDALRMWPDAKQVFELNEIILKACAPDLTQRYQTCQEMQADLALLERGKSVKRRRTRQQLWFAVKRASVTAGVIGLGAVAGYFVWQQNQPHSGHVPSRIPQAEELYQQAVYEAKAGTSERAKHAYTNLTEAVKFDPGFLDAHYMLLEVYFTDGNELPPHFNFAMNIRELAQTLKKLGPDSVQYHTVNSYARFIDWKFDQAIEEAALAKKINPRFLRAHGLYAFYVLLARRDAETALREYRVAEQLDPADVIIQSVLGDVFYAQHDYTNAIKQYSKAMELEPRINLHYNLARTYERLHSYEKAMDEYETNDLQTVAFLKSDAIRNWYIQMRGELRTNGAAGWWRRQVEENLRDESAGRYFTARFCAQLGDTNETLSLLEQAYTNRENDLIYLLVDDCWDPFRNEPRFQELVKKMGFHPTQ